MAAFQTPSILITDDDLAFRDTVREMLEPFGYRLSVAASGEEALRIVQRDDIHLLLLDMHMPKLTGVETAERIHRFKSQLPWILMSAKLDDEVLRQARRADVFTVLPKPVNRLTITQNVELALRRIYDWNPPGDWPPLRPELRRF